MKPGILPAIPMADYIADKLGEHPTLNSGIAAVLLEKSPLHAWTAHPRLNPAYEADESKDADIGSAAHEMLLGNENRIVAIDPANYAGKKGGIPDGWTNDAIRAARDQARERGGIPILLDRMTAVNDMVQAARAYIADSEIAGIFDSGAAEQTILWQEAFTAHHGEMQGKRHANVWCRARPDWLAGDRKTMLHYKTTTGSANPEAWIRAHLVNDGYDLSLAFYERGLGMFVEKPFHSIVLVQEQKPPYACSLVAMDPALAELAHRKVNMAINRWAECVASNEWRAYDHRIAWATPLPWQQAQWEEREMIDKYERDQRRGDDKTPYGEQG